MTTQTATDAAALRGLLSLHAGERLYGVFDAARGGAAAVQGMDAARERMRSLFHGPMAPHLGGVAPHLVSIDPNSGCLASWAEQWGRDAGILLISAADFDAIWNHLRGIFTAEDEDGQRFFFRFYDPRVLRVYLPTCTAGEARQLFGPVARIIVEAEDPRRALVCTRSASGAEMAELALDAGDGARGPAGGES